MDFDFSQNVEVADLSKVPADFHGLYQQADGKYKLRSDDPAVGSAVKAITGLNRALNASRGEATELRRKTVDLGPLKDFGQTPEEILSGVQAKLKEAEAAAKGKGNEDVDKAVKAAQEAMNKAHTTELEKHTKRTGALQTQLYDLLVKNEATTALAKANAIDPTLVLPFIEKQVKVMEADGQLTVRVLNDRGEERFGGTGTHMTITELVSEMRDTDRFKPLFKSEAPTGGGTVPGRPSAPRPAQGTERSSTQKIAAGVAALKK